MLKIVIVSLPKIDNFFVKNALKIAHEIVREIVHEIAPKSIPKCRQVPWNGPKNNRALFTLDGPDVAKSLSYIIDYQMLIL